jgi:capsule polysaccharide export protein KpsE/RkpR
MSNTPTVPTRSLLSAYYRNRWWIVGSSAVVAVATLLYMLTLPNYFRSNINCVPPKVDQTSLGSGMAGLGSALKDIGLSKLGGGGAAGYEFTVFLFARSVRDTMIDRFDLVKEYELEGQPRKAVLDEFESNLEIDVHPEGNYEIAFFSKDPQKAAEMCRVFVDEVNELANRVARDEAGKVTKYMERRVAGMDSSITVISDSLAAFSRKYQIVSPLDQAEASVKAVVDSKANVLKQETLLGILRESYGEGDPQVRSQQRLVEELQRQSNDMMNKPGFVGQFTIADGAGLGMQYLRMYAELEALMKVKAFLIPTLEQARLDQTRSAPNLYVVDEPLVAEKKARPKRTLIAASSGIGAGILALLIITLGVAWRAFKEHATA